MKVYILIWNFNIGGAQKHSILLANAYQRKGVEVTILASSNKGALKNLLNPKVNIDSLVINKVNTLPEFLRLRKYMLSKIEKGSIIICNGPNNFRQVARLNLLFNYWKLVFILHDDISIKKTPLSFLKIKEMSVLLNQKRSRVVALSKRQLEIHKALFNISDIKLIPNFVPVWTNKSVKTSNKLRALCLGRLSNEKGHRVLIKAMSKIKNDLWCDIYGEGALRTELQNLIESEKANVRIKEPVVDLEAVFSQYDFLVLPSLRETFGLVVIEALSFGLPVVTTDCNGPRELIEDGKNGFIVKAGDVTALEQGVKKMITALEKGAFDRELLSKSFDQCYTEPEVIKQYLSLF